MAANTLLFIVGIDGFGILMLLLFFLGPVVLWVWALLDLLRSDFRSSTDKLIWALAIVFIPVLGSLLYLLVGRGQKVKPQ